MHGYPSFTLMFWSWKRILLMTLIQNDTISALLNVARISLIHLIPTSPFSFKVSFLNCVTILHLSTLKNSSNAQISGVYGVA